MNRALFICIVFLFFAGCAQTRQNTMQQEKESLELKQRIDALAEKVEALDRSILKLSDNVSQVAEAKWAAAEKGDLRAVDAEGENLPAPAEPFEVDILEKSEERGIKETPPVTESFDKKPVPEAKISLQVDYNQGEDWDPKRFRAYL